MTKLTKWHVHPAKTQISLGIHLVWAEYSLCAQWGAKDLSLLHADSEDWSDWADAQADLRLRWAHMLFYWFCHEASQICNDVPYFCRRQYMVRFDLDPGIDPMKANWHDSKLKKNKWINRVPSVQISFSHHQFVSYRIGLHMRFYHISLHMRLLKKRSL